jgi:hypothetical protein
MPIQVGLTNGTLDAREVIAINENLAEKTNSGWALAAAQVIVGPENMRTLHLFWQTMV